MEGSPAARLPEADSLPDGFVESSAIDQAIPRSPAPAVDPPHHTVEPDQCGASTIADGETLGAASPSPRAVGGTLHTSLSTAATSTDALQSLTLNADTEPERALGRQGSPGGTVDVKEFLKESCVEEPAEYLTNQKESGVAKRKAMMRNSKLDKDIELLELAERYHKALAERDAAIAVKEKLESLCREFQRQNKVLKDECRRVSTEGQNMRMELSDKFNNVIKDVSVKLDKQKNECIAQLEENNLLRSKLKDLADQYNITQQKYAHQLKEKMLELELADLKNQQNQEKAAQEQTQMQLYAEQVSQLITTDKNLGSQLVADGEKFQQFQDALSKSNQVFGTYKQEMDKLVKVINELEKENEFFKGKCENSDIALVKLIEERELMKKQIDKLKKQKEKLESLCRSIQAERRQSPSCSIPDATSNQADLTSQGS